MAETETQVFDSNKLLRIRDAHCFVHPRVNAALVQLRASARRSAGPERSTRRDAIRVGDLLAFGRFSRVSGCGVQIRKMPPPNCATLVNVCTSPP